MNKNDLRYIKEYIKDLKLGGISSVLKEKLEEAYRTDMSYEGFLKDLLEVVVDTRRENGKKKIELGTQSFHTRNIWII